MQFKWLEEVLRKAEANNESSVLNCLTGKPGLAYFCAIKLNSASVLPVIYASAVIGIPSFFLARSFQR